MTQWSAETRKGWLIGVVGVTVVWLLAALFAVQEFFILGIYPIMLLGGGYFLWRFLVAFEAIADAQQRMARELEE